jgi:hypothetical protein
LAERYGGEGEPLKLQLEIGRHEVPGDIVFVKTEIYAIGFS